MSADWDTNKYRHGIIRHSFSDLAKIWKVSETTLRQNSHKLIKRGLLKKEKGSLKIINFEQFTAREAQKNAKEEITNGQLMTDFPELFLDDEISLNDQIKEDDTFKDSFKT
ncbi:MAG TPA: hypothetical protein VF209_01325 [Patescibacteria group bacterium]